MIARLREARLLWSGIVVLVLVGVGIALGNWQWRRLHWKQDLERTLEQAAAAAPLRMQVVPRRAASPADLAELRFRRITVAGVFEHDHEMHVWSPQPSGPAWSIVTPLRLDQTAARQTGLAARQATHILVIRGVVPQARKAPDARTAGQIQGAVTITGRVRLDQPNTWANAPNISTNQWFTRDLSAMSAHLASTLGAPLAVAPFFLEAEHALGGDPAPTPQLDALKLTNRHLEYALTWWALAATLFAVYSAFAWSRLRR